MRDKDQHANLASDFVHGFIELALPEDESVVPGHILPALLLRDASQHGTHSKQGTCRIGAYLPAAV